MGSEPAGVVCGVTAGCSMSGMETAIPGSIEGRIRGKSPEVAMVVEKLLNAGDTMGSGTELSPAAIRRGVPVVGLMLPLRESFATMQFDSRRGYVFLVLGFVVVALLATCWLKHSRFGAYLQAVRDNEDSARAIGVNPFRVKLGAIAISGALMGAGGAFYVQVFQ